MPGLPTAADERDEGAAPGMGDDEGEGMNEGNIDYLDRTQDMADVQYQGHIYSVSLEALAAVGVDISDDRQLQISEDQMTALFSTMNAPDDGIPEGPMKVHEYEEETTSDTVTISIQIDGSIKLITAGNGHESYYSQSQLAEINIDSHNMTDDDIKRIVQLAGAASGERVEYQEISGKRRKLNSGGMEDRRGEVGGMRPTIQRSYQSIHVPSHSSAASTSSGHAPSTSSGIVAGRVMGPSSSSSVSGGGIIGRLSSINNTGVGLIGESVKIQNAKGKIVSAVVRYSIPSRGFKVQYPDGKFEWVPPEKIIDRVPRLSTDARDYDHKGYTSDPPPSAASPHLAATPSTSSGGGPLMLTRRVFPSTGCGGAGGVAASGVGGSLRSAMPIRHLGPGAGPSQHHLHQHPAPNFCCLVCDRKVYQKEPAYIVIRLPACDACTREKILIVDDESTSGGGGGSRSRPTTREMATDTSDLLQQTEADEEEETHEKADDVPTSAASASSREEEDAATTPEQRPRPADRPTAPPTVLSPEGAEGEGAEKEEEEDEAASMEENSAVNTPPPESEDKQMPLSQHPQPQEVPLS